MVGDKAEETAKYQSGPVILCEPASLCGSVWILSDSLPLWALLIMSFCIFAYGANRTTPKEPNKTCSERLVGDHSLGKHLPLKYLNM